MEEIKNIQLLKRLAAQAEKLKEPEVTDDIYYQAAYKQIASGCGLLWRLLDQENGPETGGIAVLK